MDEDICLWVDLGILLTCVMFKKNMNIKVKRDQLTRITIARIERNKTLENNDRFYAKSLLRKDKDFSLPYMVLLMYYYTFDSSNLSYRFYSNYRE